MNSSRKSAPPEQRVREAMTFSRDKNFERETVIDERALVRDALRRGMGEVTYPPWSARQISYQWE